MIYFFPFTSLKLSHIIHPVSFFFNSHPSPQILHHPKKFFIKLFFAMATFRQKAQKWMACRLKRYNIYNISTFISVAENFFFFAFRFSCASQRWKIAKRIFNRQPRSVLTLQCWLFNVMFYGTSPRKRKHVMSFHWNP